MDSASACFYRLCTDLGAVMVIWFVKRIVDVGLYANPSAGIATLIVVLNRIVFANLDICLCVVRVTLNEKKSVLKDSVVAFFGPDSCHDCLC